MKVRLATFVLLCILALSLAGNAVSQGNSQTLNGQWRWSQGDEVGELRAVFTPRGSGGWDVAFHFDFRGPHIYTGTAEGSLAEGSRLTGQVQEDRGRRKWRFEGTFKNGRLDGKHFELRGRDEEASGSLTLFR